MAHLSKLVAVLAIGGVLAGPASMLLAHSSCMPESKVVSRLCYSMAVRQPGFSCYGQVAKSSCCQTLPALPTKAGTEAVPIIAFTGITLTDIATRFTSATVLNLPSTSLHCRSQAVLCVFLI